MRTSRLLLRPFVPEDFGWLHPIASDPEVTRFTTWGPNDEAATRCFLAVAVTDDHLWAVELEGRGIGSAGIADEGDDCFSFGFTLARDVWGQGFATEIAILLLSLARDEFDAGRVEATCDPENRASERVLEKAGLVLEGRREQRLVYAWVR